MAPPRLAASSSGSESEDDAPDTLTFDSSKEAAKGAEHALQQHRAAERQKRKELNRDRDRRRKEQAQSATRKGKQPAGASEESEEEGGGPKSELEARMERAMQEAELESDEEDEVGEEWGGIDDGGHRDGESDDEGSSDEDEEASDAENSNATGSDSDAESASEPPASSKKAPRAPTYLPDHLFKAALSAPASSSKRRFDTADEPSDPRPRKKRAKRPGKAKDIVAGSRTIRTLAPTSPAVPTTIPRAMMPPARVNKFLNRTLNLKGKPETARAKGWERRAANVGVMKRNGPAASFVRNQGYS
ncbi:uncharacterized protein C8Q71DRAFT_571441 [Rhodofomes roseus]|uniref:Uncharacterized protein n=1 Tax=Rhodofomes roseus TaxID=34475 RepID=A0ABQ8KIZ6_9APHY|nr:uncharacterized protein C8Q71DRAFT_571441 [Rhodofomes roseus]KAH9837980.1 hypothetical protein C8Q71DRAFT_571441 [Rhodofomes roseus]